MTEPSNPPGVSGQADEVKAIADQLVKNQAHLWAWWREVIKVVGDAYPLPRTPAHFSTVTHSMGDLAYRLQHVERVLRASSSDDAGRPS